MITYENLQNPIRWRSVLGLLPVPLLYGSQNKFILLNGQNGNFCLDLDDAEESLLERCSNAWSSNVGHYVTFSRHFVEVSKWNQPDRIEKYTTDSVINNLEKFHSYLEKNNPENDKSIVKHCLRIFRALRQILHDEENGFASLQVFLAMIASAANDIPIENLDTSKFGISPQAIKTVSIINSLDLESLMDQLTRTGFDNLLKPNYKLLLRHASGMLFQEAHLQAQISLQNWLPGIGPTQISAPAKDSLYTGVHFTPQSIARTLAEEALYNFNIKERDFITIFDPTCGSGELLKEILRILEINKYKGQIKIIGWDISSGAIDMARFSLTWEAQNWQNNRVAIDLRSQDSLDNQWPTNVDILVMNPPFQSWQGMSKQQQARVVEILGVALHNKPNLSSAFTKLAENSICDNGVLAMITPISFFESTSSKQLREEIKQIFKPKLIAKLGNQSLFYNAIVDAGLFVGRKEDSKENIGPMMVWADHSKDAVSAALRSLRKQKELYTSLVSEENFSLYRDTSGLVDSTSWSPKPYKSWALYNGVSSSKNSISASKIFDIHQGTRLGHDVFILSKEDIKKFQSKERKYFRPAVLNSSIANGTLIDHKFIFFPYGKDLENITTEKELAENVPTYYNNYLLAVKSKLKGRKTLHNSGNWWTLARPRSWQFDMKPKIVSKYFGKQGSFAFDAKGNYVVVVGHAWLFKDALPRKLEIAHLNEDITYAYIAYLNSKLVETLISYISNHVGGGQWDLSHKYLNHLPIIDMSVVSESAFSTLVELGKSFFKGNTVDLDRLDKLCLNILKSN